MTTMPHLSGAGLYLQSIIRPKKRRHTFCFHLTRARWAQCVERAQTDDAQSHLRGKDTL